MRRRQMLLKSLAMMAVPLAATQTPGAEEPPHTSDAEKALLGPWFVTAGQVSVIISVEPSGQALVVFDENGAMTIGRHIWRPLPGGVLIDTLPRFRMWHMA